MSTPLQIGIVILTVVFSFVLYQVKYDVRDKHITLATLQDYILHEKESIQILEAEWSYLNDPARLQDIVRAHGTLQPLQAGQIQTLNDLRPLTTLPVSQEGAK
ncbi:MAG: hypothetical protein V6Z81_03005 [Parvularculales bacterium]